MGASLRLAFTLDGECQHMHWSVKNCRIAPGSKGFAPAHVNIAVMIAILVVAQLSSAVPGWAASPASPSLATDASASLRLLQMPLHDPWIVADRDTATYYLYTGNVGQMTGFPGVGTMVYTSRNLRDWTRPRVVFHLPPAIWAKAGGWAPEVHAYDGRYWLFVTLHNKNAALAPSASGRPAYRRGTILAVSKSLAGPFEVVRGGEPVAPSTLMTLDGTLYIDRKSKPWLVYSHEWIQTTIGTIEALPLDRNLRASGKSLTLFKANEAPWAAGQKQPHDVAYVTDGPELFRTKTGNLLMLWSSWAEDGYVQSVARSGSGEITGPWEQLPPLLHRDSGHGMLFRTFDGTLMMILHRPFRNARGKLYEMRDAGDRLEIVRQRTDLDGGDPGPAPR